MAKVGCGAASALISPSVFASEKGAGKKPAVWKMKLSTSSIHYLHLPIEQACEQISKLGYEAIDIWSPYTNCKHLDDAKDRLGPDRLKALLANNKLKLCAFSVYKGGYLRYAELLGKIGGGLAVRDSARASKPKELTSRMRAFMEELKPQIDLAAKYNSCLAIENHVNMLLESLDSLKAFVDMNQSPRVGIALAPYHIQKIGASVEEAIRICGKQTKFFYAWQLSKVRDTKQLPGYGPVDFTKWIAALAKVGYTGYLNVFMHGELEQDKMAESLAKSRRYLQTCYAKAILKKDA